MENQIYWPSVFFLLFGTASVVFAVMVAASSNIVRMAFYLVLSLASSAGLFFLAGADFVGAMQLMIYVGGTLVLLIFGVMLTSQERFIAMQTSRFDWTAALLAGGALFALLFFGPVLAMPEWQGLERAEVEALPTPPTATPLGMGLLGARVDDPQQSGYLLVFEIISVHLLVVLIGAAYLARAKRKRSVTIG